MKRMVSPAIAVLMLSSAAYAIDYPQVKEGLWTIHTKTIDNPGNKITEGDRSICRNHAYDEHARSMANHLACKTLNENLSGGTYTVETECNVSGTVIHSKGTTVLTGDTASRSETHATYVPALYGKSETTMIIDQKYVGSCPAGAQSGDSIAKDGTITHLWKH